MPSDLVISGAKIVDGTGTPLYEADILVKDGHISGIGRSPLLTGVKVIDAQGKIVCPGFIDVHTHSDFPLLVDPLCQSSVRQGVTTEVVGNCGHSCAPVSSTYKKELRESVFGYHASVEINWRSFGDYLCLLERKGIAHNVAALVGHGAVRLAVMGFENRQPTSNELDAMCQLVDNAMSEGAVGMSTGLAYAPGSYADRNELIALCKVVAKHDGIYATHVRSYRTQDRLQAVIEAVETALESRVRLEISHHPASGDWKDTMPIIQKAKREYALDVFCDLHPYLWATSTLTVFLPRDLLGLGVSSLREKLKDPETLEQMKTWQIPFPNLTWDKIILENCRKSRHLVGKSFAEIATTLGVHPWEAVSHVLLDEDETDIYNVYARFELYRDEDVVNILKHETSIIGSDGMSLSREGLLSEYRFHPRSYGTYPKILKELVFERRLISIEEAVQKMSSVPARRFKLSGRGFIRAGYWADLTIFDPKRILDKSTYDEPNLYPQGIDYVLVNGEIVIELGNHTRKLSGKVIRSTNHGVSREAGS